MITSSNNIRMRASNDAVNSVINETFERYQSEGMNIFGRGWEEFLSEETLYSDLIENYATGMEADTAEAYTTLANNLRVATVSEQVISNISPIASLAPAILRKFFPKICIKDALPSEVTTVPVFKIGYLIPYMVDLDGNKLELPKAIREKFAANDGSAPYGRQLRPLFTGWIPSATAAGVNLLSNNTYKPAFFTSGKTGADKSYTIDANFRVTRLKIDLNDVADNNPANLTVEVPVNILKDINSNLFGNFTHTVDLTKEVSNINGSSSLLDTDLIAPALTITGVVFGHIDTSNGDFMLQTKVNKIDVSETVELDPEVSDIKITAFLSPEMHNYAESVTFELRNKEVQIGAGSHLSSPVPIEFLQDTLAMFKIDGSLKIIDLMSTALAQGVDAEAWNFLLNSYINNNLDSVDLLGNIGSGYSRSFNVIPPKEFVGRPKDWREEIKDLIDYLAIKLRNDLSYPGGKFVILANPLDARLITNINWVYSASNSERDGVQINYSVGNFQGANYYQIVSTENIPAGYMRIFFFPSQEDQMTYKYFPYTFNIESNGTYRDPNNPNVPAIMMTKRHTFEEFVPLQGVIQVLNNDGSVGSLPYNWSETINDTGEATRIL